MKIIESGYLDLPIRATWRITNKCNQGCRHCWTNSGKSSEYELSTRQVQFAADKLAEFGILMLVINGGEPMMRHDLFEIVHYLKQKGMWIQITTSGFNVDKEAAREMMLLKVNRVAVSLEGSNPQVHEVLRPKHGSFRQAIKAIETLVGVDIPVEVGTTIIKQNSDDMGNIIDLSYTLGVKRFTCTFLKAIGRGRNVTQFKCYRQEIERVIDYVCEAKTRYAGKMDIIMEDPLGACFTGDDYGIQVFKSCPAGRSQMSISPNGDINPCGYMVTLKAGNILSDDLRKVWHFSPVLNHLRAIRLSEICTNCSYFAKCLGGCRAKLVDLGGDLSAPDPDCWIL